MDPTLPKETQKDRDCAHIDFQTAQDMFEALRKMKVEESGTDEEVKQEATKVLKEFKNIENAVKMVLTKRYNLKRNDHKAGFCISEIETFYIRAGACFLLGEYEVANQDCTIALKKSLPMLSGIGSDLLVGIYGLRGVTRIELGYFNQAYTDLVGACAVSRCVTGIEWKDVSFAEPLFHLIGVMKEDEPRPHYTFAEIKDLKEKLLLDESTLSDLDFCLRCGKKCIDVKCPRCDLAHYCSKKCSKKHWERKHKHECDPLAGGDLKNIKLSDSFKARVNKEIEMEGHCVHFHRNHPLVIFRDSEAGELFDSLSNKTIF